MESTVETNSDTANRLFEGEYCYVSADGAVIRKETDHLEARQVDETSEENLEDTLDTLRNNFEKLHSALREVKQLSIEEATDWSNRLDKAEAVGDFEMLFKKIDELVTEAEQAANSENTEPQDEQEGATAEEAGEPEEEQEDENEDDIPVDEDDPLAYYKKLTNEAQRIAKGDDWNAIDKKLNQLSHDWSDGPDAESEEEEEKVRDLYYKFTKAEESFQKRREEYYAQSEKKRKENLSAKRDVLKEVEKVVNAEEWSATGKIKHLENKWNGIGSVPKEQADDMNEKFRSLVTEFKSHKVDRLVQRRQGQEDNLMMKMAVLDKMERVAGDIDDDTTAWDEIDDTFDDLTKQWKKIGRVPREKANNVWGRYKDAQDLYYDQKYRHHRDHRSNVDSFTAKKQNVIDDAEALLEQDDLAKAARKVNKLHRRWKKIGNLPQRREDKLWDQFKAATDAFNERKSSNIDKLHEQEEEHYRQKLELIEKAEQAKDTDDFDKGHQQMQSYMDRWKKIGPVPRKKSNKIWKQFKGAMDVFYDRRREHFKEAKEQQKENLKKKEAILDQLRELGHHEDPIAAVDEAKKLQSEFKNVGYVPIKKKDEMWQKYREVCDVIYDRMRAAKSGDKFERELAKADLDADQRAEIQNLRQEYKKLEKELRSLKDEVLQLEESKSNFNFSDESNPLLQNMNNNIQKAKAKLESKQNKLDALSMEIEDIRDEG